MLWYKAWMETRWRFIAGLAILMAIAVTIVAAHPMLMKMMPRLSGMLTGPLGDQLRTQLEQMQSYHAYIWTQWWTKNLVEIWTVMAVLIAAGGLLAESSRGSALFTLALPVTRRRLFGVRCAVGVLEVAALALLPSLAIRMLSPTIDQSYPLAGVLVHSALLLAGGMVFFSLTVLLSSVFADQWRPILISLGAAAVLGLLWSVFPQLAPVNLGAVMTGEDYYLYGRAPWLGVLASLAISAVLLGGALQIVEQRDF